MTERIFTIGYGNQSQEALIDNLAKLAISYVVDVRSSPFSRFKPEFSREPLAKSLKDRQIKYVFMGDLLGGRPEDEDCYVSGKVDYARVREKDFFTRGIGRLQKAHEQGIAVCLLCSEGQPEQCHRSKLIAAALIDAGIEVTHILPDGSLQSQAEVMTKLTSGQASLFEEHFTSRKSYR